MDTNSTDELGSIGFYTLSDDRARNASSASPLSRCELIVTDACNFNCPYCRGIEPRYCGTLSFESAKRTLSLWCDDGLKNVRFSGGEPTLNKELCRMVEYCRSRGVEHIAVSTNGSRPWNVYERLLAAGVNDFSVSLDACCASDGDKMAGGVPGAWDIVVGNIRRLATLTYVTVGVVLTDDNVRELLKIVEFADALCVADIRIIPAAQQDRPLIEAASLSRELLDRHPILKYRVENLKLGKRVRGITASDNHRCPLVLDDMAVLAGKHFPCIIYMRERGDAIGNVGSTMRHERLDWSKDHDTFSDPICRKNCLDVCVDYNNRFRDINVSSSLPVLK